MSEGLFVPAQHAEAFRDRIRTMIGAEGDELEHAGDDVAKLERVARLVVAYVGVLDQVGWEGPVKDSVFVPLPNALAAEFAKEWLQGEMEHYGEIPDELPNGRIDWDAMSRRVELMEYLADLQDELRPEAVAA